MADKKIKTVRVTEDKMVDLINNIVENTIKERGLVPAKTKKVVKKIKKMTVTESQLRELQKKGAKINSIVKKKR